MLHFYDSATPQNIPSGVYAGVYINGFAWSQSDIERMARIFKISVRPEAEWARIARCLDIERGAASVSNLVPFVHERLAIGKHDATAYVNRSNLLACHEAMVAERERTGNPEFVCRYWVSTLDGTLGPEFDGILAWAVQYTDQNNRFDLSVLYGVNDFVTP